ncbi:MAG: helical backbone metal receptor [Victivallaceae bacterium]|nr:helical backbone metal receptor [Victivallaceae bacterium]
MKYLFLMLFMGPVFLCLGAAGGKPVRLVSLSPNITEAVFALGREECLAGRSSACDYPVAAQQIPVTGRFGRPDFERVLAVKPDYVASSALQDRAMIKRFRGFGIEVIFLPDKSFADYFKTLETLGKILDCPELAARLIRRDQAALDEFRREADKIPAADKVKVLFVIQDTPLITVGRSSFITDMIELAGGVSVTAGQPKAYFYCPLEWVLAYQPDVLILPAMPETRARELAERPGWKDLAAVKTGRLFYKINPDLVCRMGPRCIEGIRLLRKIFATVKTGLKAKP